MDYKIVYFKKNQIHAISDDEEDNFAENLDQAIERCSFWHKKKLFHGQLLIIESSIEISRIRCVLDPPRVIALLTVDQKKYKARTKMRPQFEKNVVFVLIQKFEDLQDFTFEDYELLSDWEQIPQCNRVLEEVKCLSRSYNRDLARQDRYNKMRDNESF